jgi:hypothetical protein
MWLSVIDVVQVEQYKYTTVREFEEDMEQLVANARTYNDPVTGGQQRTPPIIAIAEALMQQCQSWLQDPDWSAKAAELEAVIQVGGPTGVKQGSKTWLLACTAHLHGATQRATLGMPYCECIVGEHVGAHLDCTTVCTVVISSNGVATRAITQPYSRHCSQHSGPTLCCLHPSTMVCVQQAEQQGMGVEAAPVDDSWRQDPNRYQQELLAALAVCEAAGEEQTPPVGWTWVECEVCMAWRLLTQGMCAELGIVEGPNSASFKCGDNRDRPGASCRDPPDMSLLGG